jgi:F-type H+-transporting ATPase subunit delta
MVNVPVARRYARALLLAAGSQADEVLEQLEAVVAFFEENKGIYATLCSPALPRNQRLAGITGMLGSVTGLSPQLANLLKLLTDRNRLGGLPLLARQYRDMVDVKLGRVRGKVSSAVKLGADQLSGIEKALAVMTGRSVVMQTKVDPSLLGGVVAQVGSRVFDGSLKTQLRQLGLELTQGR